MSEQQQLQHSTPSAAPPRSTGYPESDSDFLARQFRMSIEALERVHALSPGEFDRLVHTPVHTPREHELRTAHHEDIARRALIAAQRHLLAEEEFNIWSGRRKEDGQPVKFRFERAFANVQSPLIKCRRGALTGIVRAYVRLQDELITDLMTKGEAAATAEELLQIEWEAIRAGFLEFETYSAGEIAGWPCFPRSTGRFRGATRLRQLFERRQEELPLPAACAAQLKEELHTHRYQPANRRPPEVREPAPESRYDSVQPTSPVRRFFSRLARIFD